MDLIEQYGMAKYLIYTGIWDFLFFGSLYVFYRTSFTKTLRFLNEEWKPFQSVPGFKHSFHVLLYFLYISCYVFLAVFVISYFVLSLMYLFGFRSQPLT